MGLDETKDAFVSGRRAFENAAMKLRGHVKNGVVILEGGNMPEGTAVEVLCSV